MVNSKKLNEEITPILHKIFHKKEDRSCYETNKV